MTSPQLILQNGKEPAASFVLDRAVIRVGFGDSFDIPLPGDAEQQGLIATLRRGAEGTWRVYRRGAATIELAGTSLEPNGQAIWNDDQPMVIDGRLTLQRQDSPAPPKAEPIRSDRVNPVPKPSVGAEQAKSKSTQEVASVDAEKTDAKKSNTTPMIVLGMCALLVVSIGLSKMKRPTKTTASQPSLGTVLAVAESDPREETGVLLAKLQIARAALVRGDAQTAMDHFTSLRQKLSVQRERFEREKAATELEAIRYLEFQLEQLR